jgi:hypothetical protein
MEADAAIATHRSQPRAGQVELDLGSVQGVDAVNSEEAYEQLINHAWRCRTCWPWRNQLWAVHRLCPTGAALADRYAMAEALRGRTRSDAS